MFEEKEMQEMETQTDTAIEQPDIEPTQTEVAQAAPKETPQARNFRELKAQAEKIARERDEAVRMLKEMESSKRNQQPQQAPSYEEDDEVNLKDDELAEGKHLSKFGRKIKKLEEKLQQYERQTSMSLVEQRLKAEMPDFEKIVSASNVEALKMTYPDIANAIASSKDPYTQAKAAYTLIKQFGLAEEEDTIIPKELIKSNLAKPRPGVAAVGSQTGGISPLGRASYNYSGDLNDEMKKAFYQELLDAKMRR